MKTMADISIPKLGMSMTEATVVEWLVADGAIVAEGQDIYSVETDKATQEIASPFAGTLRILAPAGETYPVGHLIATVE